MDEPWIYLAGPLFTRAESAFNRELAEGLRAGGYRVFLPQQECAHLDEPSLIYETCLRGLKGSCLVLAVLDGPDADSGTSFEVGFACALGIPVVGLRTDWRGAGEHLGLNLMLTHGCALLILPSPPAMPGPGVVALKAERTALEVVLETFAEVPAARNARA
jgi:nucleoside 2-deoxyribosyltransferase